MLPFHPPLPTACSFPFQPAIGSQTSILMSDSFVGVSVAATRQNAGRSASAAPPRPPVCFSSPAATDTADVIVPLVSFAEDRLSHVAASAVLTARNSPAVAAISVFISSLLIPQSLFLDQPLGLRPALNPPRRRTPRRSTARLEPVR